jgi:hypothetical protein
MKNKFTTIIILFTNIPLLVFGLILFLKTIDVYNLKDTIFTLNQEQICYLLLITVSLIILYNKINESIIYLKFCMFLQIKYDKLKILNILKMFWWIIASLLCALGTIIPLMDILGSIPGSLSTNYFLFSLRLSLIILNIYHITYLFDGSSQTIDMLKSVTSNNGLLSVLDRYGEHDFLFYMLDEVSPNDAEILVTHFEEPRNAMKDKGYYYEGDFMKKWYTVIKEKKIKVNQIILINSLQDVEDLKQRLELIKDIPNYSIGYIISPPLTVFIDFLVVPNEYVLISSSDDVSCRNMNVFSFLIRGGKGVKHFEKIFRDILASEARYIKTFEGVDNNEVNNLCEQINKILSSKTALVKKMFNIVK